MARTCPSCGSLINDEAAAFCPHCGSAMQPQDWACSQCGAKNPADAAFCMKCGQSHAAPAQASEMTQVMPAVQPMPQAQPLQQPVQQAPSRWREKWDELRQHPYFRYVLALIAVMVIGAGGSYYYFNNMNEGHYLSKYTEAARKLEATNDLLVSNTAQDKLKADTASDISQQLTAEKDEIDALAHWFSDKRAFKGYEAQHKSTLELLQKESALLAQAVQVIDKPLEQSQDDVISGMKDEIQSLKDMSAAIKLPDINMSVGGNLNNLPTQLQSYVAEQRRIDAEKKRIEAEKKARLQAMQNFFAAMDEAISTYNGAKGDLGGMMESSRKGGMIWSDYFRVLDNAKSSRQSVRWKVEKLQAPAGTEGLKNEFLRVLGDSIRYCEVMRIGANLSFNRYYGSAYQKDREAKAIDEQVQSEYAAFMERYEEAKARLTNPANL